MDAAIAACAVQCVVEPGSTGIGGDCFALYAANGSNKVFAYNGSGRAPAAAHVEKLAELGVTSLERTSPIRSLFPGAVDAWVQLNADHGKMPIAEILQSAINYARNGFPISPRVHADFTSNLDHLNSNENLAKVFLSNGKVPAIGTVLYNTGLADVLEMIGRDGRDAFYLGEIASEMVDTLQAKGGLHTLEDFAQAKGTYETPVTTNFRDNIIHECPPQGQGIIALLMLNMMKEADARSEPLSTERIHRELETCRRGYASRSIYLADPAHFDVPVVDLLSSQYAAQLRDDIDLKQARHPNDIVKLKPHQDTVYISVVDKDRNSCSFINTMFWGWGSGITTPKHHIVLTNRGEGFVLEPGHPNCIAPNKRPLHTIIPAMVEQNGKNHHEFWSDGGRISGHGPYAVFNPNF